MTVRFIFWPSRWVRWGGMRRAARALPRAARAWGELTRGARSFAEEARAGRPGDGPCLYGILGVPSDAPTSRIKAAFRATAKRLHPDVVSDDDDDGMQTEAFVRVVAAYEILTCERRRALYDAERAAILARGTFGLGTARDGQATGSARWEEAYESMFARSEILRDYRGALNALVPRRRLREELYAALVHVIEGPALDVEEVVAGRRFPKYFEAEERTTVGAVHTAGVDLMHVVAGRTLLAAVREWRDPALGAGNAPVAGLKGDLPPRMIARDDPAEEEDLPWRSDGCESERKAMRERVRAARGHPGESHAGNEPREDARLELVVGGRTVATAVRRVSRGVITVYDNQSIRGGPGRAGSQSEASLLAADLNNWSGYGHVDADVADEGGTSRAYAARGPSGEAFTITGLSGSFDVARVCDAEGRPVHTVVSHATPGVTHLHWFDAETGEAAGRASRAWMPPSGLWMVTPRSDDHTNGGWYFELPPGPPRERRHAGLLAASEAVGKRRRRRGAWDEFRDDVTTAMRFGAKMGWMAPPGEGLGSRRRRCAPLPPAVALFTTAFRLLDRERGEDHGFEGAARRAWVSIFGAPEGKKKNEERNESREEPYP